jgi:hypothetical protein
LHAAGAADLVLRNVNTGQFEVYDIVNNQITSAFNIGAVGLDFQLGGFAVDPPTVSGTFTDISSDQLAQNGGGGAADNSNDISWGRHVTAYVPDGAARVISRFRTIQHRPKDWTGRPC